MLRLIPEKLRQFQQRLTRMDDQPLGRAALVVIIFLDLFILVSIFDGLADHTAQLAGPDERVPPLCRSLVIDREWNPTNRLDGLARIVSDYQADPYRKAVRTDRGQQHPLCAPIVGAYEAIRDNAGLARTLEESRRLRKETQDLRAELERMKGAYDTALLETIAGAQPADKDTSAIRKTMADKAVVLNDRVGRQALLDASIEQDPRVHKLFESVERVSDTQRTDLRDELRRLNFWYPAKRLGMEMLFLLPLLAVFYFWNAKSIAATRPFQILVSSHLLVVAFIPVFFKIAELVYDIIPRKLLRQVIELLESLKLVAIWYYLLIGAAIIAALALIYLFQKKLFSREKLLQRRIAKGLCQMCGLQLPSDSPYCPACGAGQFRTCSRCNALTHVHGRFCRECGLDAQSGN
ncbi:MAG: zinc ribbon domain-containing protein [Thiobacillus sp.]|nr:zinc ribbon domain-containing protein [Thiobacillus sp.]